MMLVIQGSPADFEAIGNRLGFRITSDTNQSLSLVWRGPRFPAYLCLGMAFALLLISVPIIAALNLRGFVGPAGSMWYFPVMNFVLFGVAAFLLAQKRTILFDHASARAIFRRRSLHQTFDLQVPYARIEKLRLGTDQVYSGFALAGSSADQTFPVPSLRVILDNRSAVLLDRGSVRRLKALADQIGRAIAKPVEIDPELQPPHIPPPLSSA
jgi:hypothetical protein